jgi:single-strand DNA-binding protein
MPKTFARFQILGNVGRDPEVEEWNGAKRVRINIATTKEWKAQEGNKQEKTSWHSVTAWRKTAEILGEYVKKGSKLLVDGNIETNESVNDDGTKKYNTNFTITDFTLLGSSNGNGSSGNNKPTQRTDSYSPSGGDDIPF